ncbi:MAG: ABC transporter ATP-binding protein [Pelagimonas sp.]|nr:ABC transporter ATP-binding protein [Pelagimonas sp.]
MTELSQVFEDFGEAKPTRTVAENAAVIDEVDLEGVRLDAFEKGYRAGWDDAIKAQSEDRDRISNELGQHLQDLSFTYHEACSHVINALTPLLNEMVQVVLPSMSQASLQAHIVEQLQAIAKEVGGMDVVIAVSPANSEALEPLMDQDFGFPIQLLEDPDLAAEQADIRFGQTEKQIDLGDLLSSLKEAVDGFAHENRRKIANG